MPFSASLNLAALDNTAVEELPTANGPADYGSVRCRQVTRDHRGQESHGESAERPRAGEALCAGCSHGPSANGTDYACRFSTRATATLIWHLDARQTKRSRAQSATSTRRRRPGCAVRLRLRARARWLLDTPPERIERLRPYQRDCIVAVESAIIGGRRDLMVAMATGTGKTFLTVAQIYRLLESKLVPAHPVSRGSQGARRAGRARVQRLQHAAGKQVHTGIRSLFSQRFQREDFGDDDPFDPKVLPNEYLTAPKPSHTFVYVSTIQRMARNLFGAEGSFRAVGRRRRARGRCRQARHSDPRLRPHHRRRMSPRLHGTGDEHLARHPPALRRDPDRPHRHASRAHRRALWRASVPLRRRAGDPRRLARGLRAGRHQIAGEDERRIPQGRRTGRQGGHARPAPRRSTRSKTSATFDATAVERDITAPDCNRKIIQEIAKHAYEHEAGDRALPENPHLRRQRSAAHVPRRSARAHLPRGFRPGRRLRAEDHRQPERGSPTPAHPRVPQPPESEGRRHAWICSRPAWTSRRWSSSCSCAR